MKNYTKALAILQEALADQRTYERFMKHLEHNGEQLMNTLQRGDKVYLITGLEIKEVRIWLEVGNGDVWLIYADDYENHSTEDIEDCGYYFCGQSFQWRRTRPEALHLLRENLEQRRVQLLQDIEEIDDKIVDVINELYR